MSYQLIDLMTQKKQSDTLKKTTQQRCFSAEERKIHQSHQMQKTLLGKRKGKTTSVPESQMTNAINFSLSNEEIAREVKSYAPLYVFALTQTRRFGADLPEYAFNRNAWIHIDMDGASEKQIAAVSAMPIRAYLYLASYVPEQKKIELIQNMPPYTVLLLDKETSINHINILVSHLPKNVELGIGSFPIPYLQPGDISSYIPEECGLYLHAKLDEETIKQLLNHLKPGRTIRTDPWMSAYKRKFVAENAPLGSVILCTQDTNPRHIEIMMPIVKQNQHTHRFLNEKMKKGHVERTEMMSDFLDTQTIDAAVNYSMK